MFDRFKLGGYKVENIAKYKAKYRFKLALVLAIATFATVILSANRPTMSAERIDFNYSLLGFKIKVKDLEAFVKRGEISDSLDFYLQRIPPKQTERLQKLLGQSYDVDPILLYRYSRTSAGVKMLHRIGEIIKLPRDINGFYGLRAAVVQAAQSPGGINLIDFLQRFPTDINLDLEELLKLVRQVSQAETDTQDFIASLASLDQGQTIKGKANFQTDFKSTKEASDFSRHGQHGQFQVTKQTLELYDRKRDRQVTTDLYLPDLAPETSKSSKSVPVIVVSNGLGAKRDRFQALANHLTSYGFAVVIPGHVGSDRQRQKDFVRGLYKENFDATEYIDRPLDISYVLDELAKRNQRQFQNALNLTEVGIFGYSIGGTTALSLAGAEIDFLQLKRDCSQKLNLLNISILYQCRALDIPRKQKLRKSLKDERIKAAFMFVPFGKSMFSQQSLKKVSIPVMWQVVDQDFLTSLEDEQVPLFNSLEHSDHYLVISEKLPHSNVTLSNQQKSTTSAAFEVAKTYQNILSLVFFQNYIAQDPEYDAYLNPEYIQAIAQKPYNLHILARQSAKR